MLPEKAGCADEIVIQKEHELAYGHPNAHVARCARTAVR
jgi:hypothetical protein